MTAKDLIQALNLQPHPEGGWFAETWRSPDTAHGRSVGTAIYYLLESGQSSHWHRVDADEVWHFYAGDPLILSISEYDNGPAADHVLGTNLSAGQRPQFIVPKGFWQAARPMGAFTLVGCTVAPGFEFSGFELAPKGFEIPTK